MACVVLTHYQAVQAHPERAAGAHHGGVRRPGRGRAQRTALLNDYQRRSGLVDATLIVYEGARHEVFNEINQEEVRGDLIRWLDERFAVD